MNCNEKPIISIIMPAYNAGIFLQYAVDSILNQTYKEWELLIVDDNSCDGTTNIINSYKDCRVKYFRNTENKGPAYSRNLAIQYSIGKYIAIMDADDIAMPERLEIQSVFLENHLDIDVLGSKFLVIDKDGDVILSPFFYRQQTMDEVFVNTLFACPILHSSVMIRREFWTNNELSYNLEYPCNQDYELWSRVIFIGKMFIIPQCLVKYRISEQQISRSKRDQQLALATKLRRALFLRLSLNLSNEELEVFNQIETGEISNISMMEETLRKLLMIKYVGCDLKLLRRKVLNVMRKYMQKYSWPYRVLYFVNFQYRIGFFSGEETLHLLLPKFLIKILLQRARFKIW